MDPVSGASWALMGYVSACMMKRQAKQNEQATRSMWYTPWDGVLGNLKLVTWGIICYATNMSLIAQLSINKLEILGLAHSVLIGAYIMNHD